MRRSSADPLAKEEKMRYNSWVIIVSPSCQRGKKMEAKPVQTGRIQEYRGIEKREQEGHQKDGAPFNQIETFINMALAKEAATLSREAGKSGEATKEASKEIEKETSPEPLKVEVWRGTRNVPIFLYDDETFTYGGSNHFKEAPDFVPHEAISQGKATLARMKKGREGNTPSSFTHQDGQVEYLSH